MSGFASCCVLSYNRPNFLPQMLQTLVGNAGRPLELIVHDDGSSDPHVIEYLHRLHKLGYISTLIVNTPGHNQGVGTAMNRMFQLASGDPIIKLDQDLIFHQDWLAKTVDILGHNHLVSTRQAQPLLESGPEPPIGALGAFKYGADPVKAEDMFLRRYSEWEHHADFVGSFIAVPRYVWEKHGPFEQHSDAFAEDIEFKQRLMADDFALALPPEDIATNHGFGPGPSTVVESFDEETGQGTVHKIHHGPYVLEPHILDSQETE